MTAMAVRFQYWLDLAFEVDRGSGRLRPSEVRYPESAHDCQYRASGLLDSHSSHRIGQRINGDSEFCMFLAVCDDTSTRSFTIIDLIRG